MKAPLLLAVVAILALFAGCNPVIDPIGDQAVVEGGTLDLTVSASSPDGQIPALEVQAGTEPPGAVFTDHLDGTGTLSYVAPTGVSRVFENVTFTATTSLGSTSESIHIFVDDLDSGGVTIRFFYQGKNAQHGIAVDAAGDLYLADWANTVWKVSGGTESVFTTILGGKPSGLVFDDLGRLYVSATQTGEIHRVVPDGTRTLFTDGLTGPWELGFDSLGNLYVACYDGSVYKVAPDGTKTAFGGAFTAEDPFGVAVDSSDNVFVSEHYHEKKIWSIDPGGTKTLFASGLTQPEGLAMDGADNLYVADTALGTVTSYDPAGTPTVLAEGMSIAVGLAFGPGGELYVACAGVSGRVYVLTPVP